MAISFIYTYSLYLSLFFSFLFTSNVYAISLIATGSPWNVSINSTGLQAGDNLPSTQSSIEGQTVLSISNVDPISTSWVLKIRRTATDFPDSVIFEVKRSGGSIEGNCQTEAFITGGESFTEITTTNTTLFSGCGDYSNINLQFKLSGIDIALGQDDFSSSITYEVVELF